MFPELCFIILTCVYPHQHTCSTNLQDIKVVGESQVVVGDTRYTVVNSMRVKESVIDIMNKIKKCPKVNVR
jgi:hypothetical protein